MRFYILDDLVSPDGGQPLRVKDAHVVEREGLPTAACTQWCGRLGVAAGQATAADCAQCAKLWIDQATLTDGTHTYPVVAGIPRFVAEVDANIDGDTQESFGYEWEKFDRVLPEYDAEVDNYFGIVAAETLRDSTVLDAGCGMGRWARQIATRPVRRLYAVDFSRAIDRAARTLVDCPNAHCIQADVCRLPFRTQSFDFTYCLGVLHHLQDPDAGMRSVSRVTAGPLLVYLYYSLDNRPRFHRMLLAVATMLRLVTSRLPKRGMFALSWVFAALIYWPLARLAKVLSRLGLKRAAHQVPLSHYRDYSFEFMVGDAFDRFATPIENRYSRAEISAWFARYGRDASFSSRTPFWVSLGTPKQ